MKHLLYGVPNPRLPFLGVHMSHTIYGKSKVGPNAVLAFKREGYRRRDVSARDLAWMLAYPGFWKMGMRYGTLGLREGIRSLFKSVFVRSAQRLIPELASEDLVPASAGVRAQAVRPDGSPLDDFAIARGPHAIHVLNVPSPAATASLQIGNVIADMCGRTLNL